MPYPAISSRRMPYDIDGTEVGYRYINTVVPSAFAQGVESWLSLTDKQNLNKEVMSSVWQYGNARSLCFWWFFPELREITHIGMLFNANANEPSAKALQGSVDSTNGMDGTWEPAVFDPIFSRSADFWRSDIYVVSFSGPKKALRIGFHGGSGTLTIGNLSAAHVYGYKAAGETPDDILFVDSSTGAEKTALMDWGDQPEGTTEIDSFKVKNVSASKIANDINLQLNHADFLMSWSADGPWTATLDIATLGIGALSNTVYVRNKLEPPLLILGPYAARVIASVGSWT